MIQIKRHQRGCIGHVQKTKHLIWLECRLQRKNGCVQPFKVAKALLMLQEVVFLVLAKGAGCGVFLWFLGKREMGGRSLEKGMATHSSILAWRILWTQEPGGLQSMGSKESDMVK